MYQRPQSAQVPKIQHKQINDYNDQQNNLDQLVQKYKNVIKHKKKNKLLDNKQFKEVGIQYSLQIDSQEKIVEPIPDKDIQIQNIQVDDKKINNIKENQEQYYLVEYNSKENLDQIKQEENKRSIFDEQNIQQIEEVGVQDDNYYSPQKQQKQKQYQQSNSIISINQKGCSIKQKIVKSQQKYSKMSRRLNKMRQLIDDMRYRDYLKRISDLNQKKAYLTTYRYVIEPEEKKKLIEEIQSEEKEIEEEEKVMFELN